MSKAKKATTMCEAGIVSLCFNGDGSKVAFSPNNHLVLVADRSPAPNDCVQWKVTHTLEGHDQPVSGIDWAPNSNQIVSCAQDRTAFVWSYNPTTNEWTPSLIMLDANVKRGLTTCRWSANERKVYIGSAANNFAVGWWVEKSHWWWCKIVDAHRSTITAVAPNPKNDAVVATGSTDCTVKILSTYFKSLDGPTGEKLGTVYKEIRLGGWVTALAWSPSGQCLAIATHDSRIMFAVGDSATMFENYAMFQLSLRTLPFRSVLFLHDDLLIAAGHDYYPMAFSSNGTATAWQQIGAWKNDAGLQKEMSATELARKRFQSEASLGQAEAVTLPSTKHKNTITKVVAVVDVAASPVLPTSKELTVAFATSSMDGRVELWSMGEMTS